jgi:hypothetical protein
VGGLQKNLHRLQKKKNLKTWPSQGTPPFKHTPILATNQIPLRTSHFQHFHLVHVFKPVFWILKNWHPIKDLLRLPMFPFLNEVSIQDMILRVNKFRCVMDTSQCKYNPTILAIKILVSQIAAIVSVHPAAIRGRSSPIKEMALTTTGTTRTATTHRGFAKIAGDTTQDTRILFQRHNVDVLHLFFLRYMRNKQIFLIIFFC